MCGAGESVLFVIVSGPGEGNLVTIITRSRVFLVIREQLSIRCSSHGVTSSVVSRGRESNPGRCDPWVLKSVLEEGDRGSACTVMSAWSGAVAESERLSEVATLISRSVTYLPCGGQPSAENGARAKELRSTSAWMSKVQKEETSVGEGRSVDETEEGASCLTACCSDRMVSVPSPNDPGTASSPVPARRVQPDCANHFLHNSRITLYHYPSFTVS